jgi:hypothetical protein
VLNSVLSYNNAVGCCSNPANAGTPGGGSGGAIYPGIFYRGSGSPNFTGSTIS